jgi:hypothetical protein
MPIPRIRYRVTASFIVETHVWETTLSIMRDTRVALTEAFSIELVPHTTTIEVVEIQTGLVP